MSRKRRKKRNNFEKIILLILIIILIVLIAFAFQDKINITNNNKKDSNTVENNEKNIY